MRSTQSRGELVRLLPIWRIGRTAEPLLIGDDIDYDFFYAWCPSSIDFPVFLVIDITSNRRLGLDQRLRAVGRVGFSDHRRTPEFIMIA